MLKSGLIFSFFTLISRILGLVRDIVVAALLGGSAYSDAFFLANRIPNFLRRIFGEGAFSKAFVPVLTEIQTNEDEQAMRDFIAKISGSLGVVVSIVTLFGIVFSGVVTALFAFGWFLESGSDPVAAFKFAQSSMLLKITFPYLFFITFVALSGGILNTIGNFSVMAFSPILLNVAIILTAYFGKGYVSSPDIALAWGVFLGGLAQFIFQIPFLKKAGFLVKPKIDFKDEKVKKVEKLMLPAIFGVSVTQINLLINQIIASFLITGSISYLYYADRLVELPLGVFGIAISTVILPRLSRIAKNQQISTAQKEKDFKNSLDWGVKMVLFIGIPATAALMVLSKPLLITLFMRGQFDALAADNSSKALFVMALSLVSYMLISVLANGFYAHQNTKTPVKIGIIATICNLVFAVFTIWFSFVGLALASALSALVNAILLYVVLHKEQIYQMSKDCLMFTLKVTIATIVMIIFLVHYVGNAEFWLSQTMWSKCYHLGLLILSGGFIYLFCLIIQRVTLRDFKI